MRVAITGISGYLGTRLLCRLDSLESIERVVGVDVREPQLSPSKLRFYRQNIVEPLTAIFTENEIDTAIHLAFVLMPSRDWKHVRQIDVDGTVNFLEGCQSAHVKHIIFLSSHSAYGAHPDNPLPLTEDYPLRPLDGFQYSLYKAETDRIFQDFAASNGDICVTILRTCVVMGPNSQNAITRSLFKPVIISVMGHDPLMQFVHEDDLVELMLTVLNRKHPGIFNVAGEGTIHYRELATLSSKRLVVLPDSLLRFIMNFSWHLHLQSESPAEGLSFIKYPVVLSTEKIKRETGFQFKYSSRDAVNSFILTK